MVRTLTPAQVGARSSAWSHPDSAIRQRSAPADLRNLQRLDAAVAECRCRSNLLHFVALDARPASALQSPSMPLNLGMSLTVSVTVDARLRIPLGIRNEFAGRVGAL